MHGPRCGPGLAFPYVYIVQSNIPCTHTHCITVTDIPTGLVSMEWDSHFSTSVLYMYIPHHILLQLLQLTTILLVLWKRERPLDKQDSQFLLLFKCLLHMHTWTYTAQWVN